MFYRNSQGNIINLDNVREIVKLADVPVRERNSEYKHRVSEAGYYIDQETYRVLEKFKESKLLDEFMVWLWYQIYMARACCTYGDFLMETERCRNDRRIATT